MGDQDKMSFGYATYPVDYEYDCYGNKIAMTTYRTRALCWSGCSIKYGSCLATAHETLISFAVGTAAAVFMCSSGGAAVIFAF